MRDTLVHARAVFNAVGFEMGEARGEDLGWEKGVVFYENKRIRGGEKNEGDGEKGEGTYQQQ